MRGVVAQIVDDLACVCWTGVGVVGVGRWSDGGRREMRCVVFMCVGGYGCTHTCVGDSAAHRAGIKENCNA